jgi:GntR family transcriptional regulator, transcriptional repressor for pyruvate dehydrogenase complex
MRDIVNVNTITRPPRKTSTHAGFSSKLQRVSRTSLSEDIAHQILALISTGDLGPGERLPSERELCTLFGVGRSSLREAIRCLVIVGILDVSVGNGTFLATNAERFIGKVAEWRVLTEHQNMENLMEVRLALECAASARAAMCGTEKHFRGLEDLIKKMRRSVSQPKQFIALDLEFHVLLAEASNNPLLVDLLNMLRKQLSSAMLTFVTMPGGAALACKHHDEMLAAIRNRDSEAARMVMQIHLSSSLERYRKAGVGSAPATTQPAQNRSARSPLPVMQLHTRESAKSSAQD